MLFSQNRAAESEVAMIAFVSKFCTSIEHCGTTVAYIKTDPQRFKIWFKFSSTKGKSDGQECQEVLSSVGGYGLFMGCE
jgi:hypothetical protein